MRSRRAWLRALLAPALLPAPRLALPAGASTSEAAQAGAALAPDPVRRGRALAFPRDHGAHPGTRIEWWYATGWLQGAEGGALVGFQVTFFRLRTALAATSRSRFAARQILFAHAAVSDLGAARHRHAERIARWSGEDDAAAPSSASALDADVRVGGWQIARRPDHGDYETQVSGPAFALRLRLRPTQPLLPQGDAGFSRKGPDERNASHYYSEPQLTAAGKLELDGRGRAVQGRAWLDHEWSDEVLHPDAVGWDWIGINLDNGGALTAFRLRRADGSALWAGGSRRAAGAIAARVFAPDEVTFVAGRTWRSAATGANYPVQWHVRTTSGRFEVRALMDAQELDGRTATGSVYWEGLAELLDERGVRLGLGYLEMTGYAQRMRL
jgi:predicted secreted hydrolase